MSTTNLPPVPYKTPLVDRNQNLNPIWADWLKQAYIRLGGPSAIPNNQIVVPPFTTAEIANNAITAALIASAVAGSGLTGGGGSALSVVVDGATIAISANTLGVPTGGIGTTQIAASAVTNAKLAGSITFANLLSTDWSSNSSATGYQKLGTGIYVQWGVTGAISSNATGSESFATSFPNACLQVVAGIQGDPGIITATGSWGTGSYSTSGFTMYNRTTGTQTFNYVAVGH